MRKGLTAIACVLAAMWPAVALGGLEFDPEYGGKLEDRKNRYIGFDVKGSGADRKIKDIFVVNMFFECESMDGGPQTGELRKAVDVKANGKFDETFEYEFEKVRSLRGGESRGLKYRLAGDLDGNKATGTLRIQLRGGGGCDSGTQSFVAKKPAPKPPEPNNPLR